MRRDELDFHPPGRAVEADSELLRAIFETASDCIITIDEGGTIESVNPAVERVFGYPRAELLGRNVSMLMPSPDREQHDLYVDRYLRTGERHVGRDIVAQRRDGTTFPAHLAVSEMTINGQRKFAGIIRDTSERMKYEQSLRQRAKELHEARDELEAANRSKDEFIAVLSHELRTPLTPVLAMLSSLESEPGVSGDLKDALRTIRRNVELESRLIDDLLDATCARRGKLRVNLEEADVHAGIADTLAICRPDIEAHLLNVETDLQATSHFITGDPARLRQVLWNLLKNAIKFTPRGGRVQVSTWNERKSLRVPPDDRLIDAVVIEVRDTGIGMEHHSLQRIFNAFEQASASVPRQFGGLGLGLAISRAIVEMHHGLISAASEGLGKGSSFKVELPAIRELVPANSEPAHPSEARHVQLKRILLVEDHPDTLRVISLLLKRSGHEVLTASSVSEGRQRLAEGVDVLISDIGLPDGSGMDLMRDARKLGGIKGIALSGYGMDDDVRRSRQAGFDEHLTKPVDLSRLLQAIARVTEPCPT